MVSLGIGRLHLLDQPDPEPRGALPSSDTALRYPSSWCPRERTDSHQSDTDPPSTENTDSSCDGHSSDWSEETRSDRGARSPGDSTAGGNPAPPQSGASASLPGCSTEDREGSDFEFGDSDSSDSSDNPNWDYPDSDDIAEFRENRLKTRTVLYQRRARSEQDIDSPHAGSSADSGNGRPFRANTPPRRLGTTPQSVVFQSAPLPGCSTEDREGSDFEFGNSDSCDSSDDLHWDYPDSDDITEFWDNRLRTRTVRYERRESRSGRLRELHPVHELPPGGGCEAHARAPPHPTRRHPHPTRRHPVRLVAHRAVITSQINSFLSHYARSQGTRGGKTRSQDTSSCLDFPSFMQTSQVFLRCEDRKIRHVGLMRFEHKAAQLSLLGYHQRCLWEWVGGECRAPKKRWQWPDWWR